MASDRASGWLTARASTAAPATAATPRWWRDGERRYAKRVPLQHSVTLVLPSGAFPATTVDINVGGILLQMDGPAQVGDACQIHLFTAQGLLHLAGAVVRTPTGRVAIRFGAMTPDQACGVRQMIIHAVAPEDPWR